MNVVRITRELVSHNSASRLSNVSVSKAIAGWMRKAGLEWLFRLLRQPWRWRRMLALPQAAWLVFWQRFKERPWP